MSHLTIDFTHLRGKHRFKNLIDGLTQIIKKSEKIVPFLMERTFWSVTFDPLREFHFILIVTGRKTMQFLNIFRYSSSPFK